MDHVCKYLGGNLQLDDKLKAFNEKNFGSAPFGLVFLRIDSERINILPSYPLTPKIASQNPIYSLEFRKITSIQNLPSERVSTATTFWMGPVIASHVRKTEFCLVINFKDEIDLDQSLTFKTNNDNQTYREMYERLAQLKQGNASKR